MMSKLFEKAEHDTKSYESRQHALELLQEACEKQHVCAACGASAGMYLSGLAARAIGYDREQFLQLAVQVWEDLERQAKEQAAN
jgi:hypothetical protein